MIHLPRKNFAAPPDRLVNDFARGKIRNCTSNFDGERCDDYYKHEQVTNLLRAYSIGKNVLAPGDKPKCNYCESRLEKGVTLQVEHFRPKAKVDAIDNKGFDHHGYYWLGLEWSNLLLSCPKCNGKGAKGNRFPIKGARAIPREPVNAALVLDRTGCYSNLVPLMDEQPLLLNPEVDYPETCLTFDNQAELSGYGVDADKGETSKDIYRLNRGPLIEDRQDVRNCFLNDLNEDIAGHVMGLIDENALLFNFKKVCKKIRKRKDADQEFTLWGRYINDNFQYCIVDFIDIDYRGRLLQMFNEVINEENVI